MSDRPSIDPALVAALVAQAPARVLKKVEAEASTYAAIALVAEGDVLVARVGNERVRLTPSDGSIGRAEQLACSCLLAPRCAHLVGIARSLPLAPASDTGAPVASGTEQDALVDEAPIALDAAQREAASQAFGALAHVVEHGAASLGALREAALLRAIHATRLASLPRLASALVRVVRGARALASSAPDFELEVLAADLHEALRVAHLLSVHPTAAAVGRHRRAMEPLGALQLTGLFTEPVLAGTGHAGVVTTLVADDGRFFTLADVRPGEPTRALASYEAGVRIGEATLSHRELCRARLYVHEAMASVDGRLGQGQDVRAVRRGHRSWRDAPTGPLFDGPARTQLARIVRDAARAPDEHSPGWDLLLTRGALRARAADALVFEALDGTSLVVEIASDHPTLRDRDTQRVLGTCEGLKLGLALRVSVVPSLRLRLVAVFAEPGEEASLVLPQPLHDRIMPGLDVLHASALARAGPCPRVELAEEPDPLAPVSRRLLRFVSGGRASIGAGSRDAVEREARNLERVGLASAADVLRALASEAVTRTRDLRGLRDRGDPVALTRALLAALEVADAIRLSLLA